MYAKFWQVVNKLVLFCTFTVLSATNGLSNPIADWHFDEPAWSGLANEVVDSAGSFDSDAIGITTTTTAQVCRAGDFSATGISDYLSLDSSVLDNATDFTISIWAKTSDTGQKAIISGSSGSQHNELIMWFPSSTVFRPFIRGSSSSISISNISDDVWHHLVWTRSGASNCLYIDGVLQGCTNRSAAALNIANGGLIVGQEQDSLGGGFSSSQAWDGELDELLIFDRALTISEVQSIYSNQSAGNNWDGSTRTCSILTSVAEYRFDRLAWDGTVDEVLDSSGNNLHGTAQNALPASGLVCNAADFDGTNSITVPNDTLLEVGKNNADYTVNFWLNLDSSQLSSWRNVLHKGGGAFQRTFAVWLRPGGNNRLHHRISTLATSNAGHDTTGAVATNAWTMVTLVKSGNQLLTYLDGSLDTSSTLSADSIHNTGPLYIGKDPWYQGMRGLMDELVIFDQALSVTEIQSIRTNNLAGNNWNGASRICSATPVAEYRFDESLWDGTADEVIDTIGSFNSDAIGMTTTSTAQICRAGDFSATGVSDYLSLDSDVLNNATNFSISVWAKTTDNGQKAIVSGSSGSQHNELIMWFPNSTTFRPFLKGSNSAVSISNIADDAWHHLVWTRTGSSNCIYVDGVLQGCVTLTSASVSIASGGLVIGQEQDSLGGGFAASQAWDGELDELLIFDQGLTATDVQSIYNNQLTGRNWDGSVRACTLMPIAEYRFDESTWGGTTDEVLDSSGNNLHGTAQNALPASGLVCNAADFDGANSITVPNDTLLEVGKNNADYTVNFWLNLDSSQLNSWRNVLHKGGGAFQRTFAVWLRPGGDNRLHHRISTLATSNAGHDTTGSVATNAWTMVTLVKSGNQLLTYLDGSLDTSSTLPADSIHNTGPLYIGKDPWYQGMRGLMDELIVFDSALSVANIQSIRTNTLAGNNWNGSARVCPISALDHLEIQVNGSASTCLPSSVTIRACSDNLSPCTLLTTYANNVDLSTSTLHGTWAISAANGALSNGASNTDGNATYQFDVLDGGQVTLNLSNQFAEDLTITASDAVESVNVISNTVQFRDNAFVITDIDSFAVEYELIAGRDHSFEVTAWQRDTTQTPADCAVMDQYAGNKSLRLWRTRDIADPGGNDPSVSTQSIPDTLPGSDNITLNFVAGRATFNLSTSDVGKFDLNIQDSNAPVSFSGSSDGTATVRPFGLGFTNTQDTLGTNNPGGTATTGSGFISAGSQFVTTVGGYLYNASEDTDNNGVPDTGADITDNGLTPNFAADVDISINSTTPTGSDSVQGSLFTASPAVSNTSFSGGSGQSGNITYSEVGSVMLSGVVSNYLNSGVSVTGLSPDIGRFFPHTLALTDNGVVEGGSCNDGFVYMNESDLAIRFTLEARNVAGNRTLNYDSNVDTGFNVGYNFISDIDFVAEANDNGVDIANRLSPNAAISNWSQGELTYLQTGRFNKHSLVDYIASLMVGIYVSSSSDGENITGLDMDVDTTGICATCDEIALNTGIEMRYGRLRSENAFGPETHDLPLPIVAEYFDGTEFVINTSDNCTSLLPIHFDLAAVDDDNSPDNSTANPAAGVLTNVVVDSGSSDGVINNSPLLSGDTGFSFTAPGAGNTGAIEINIDLSLGAVDLLHLQFDWDGNSSDDNPANVKANFGSYRGHDRIIFWRER